MKLFSLRTFSRNRAGKAYTLLELLIVISIIATLAAIATPVSMSVMNQARTTECAQQMSNLITAMKGYKMEYGHIPIKTGLTETDLLKTDSGDGINLIKCLTGENNVSFKNPRGIVFFEPNYTDTKKGGLDAITYALYDPWGRPYEMLLDVNFDKEIDAIGLGFRGLPPVRKEILIISRGKDNTDLNDVIFSWKK